MSSLHLFRPARGRGFAIVVALAALDLAGCAGGTASAPVDCETLAGLERDQCLHDALISTPADQPDLVIEKAKAIQDPMVRQAGVSSWARDYVTCVPAAKGRELCNLLEGRDRSYCERQISSPHLVDTKKCGERR